MRNYSRNQISNFLPRNTIWIKQSEFMTEICNAFFFRGNTQKSGSYNNIVNYEKPTDKNFEQFCFDFLRTTKKTFTIYTMDNTVGLCLLHKL